MNISLSRPKPGFRERYDAVQNSAGRLAALENLQNAPEAAILAPFERFWAPPAARTKCFLLSKTPRAKAVLDTSDPDMGYLALLDPGIDRRRFYSEDYGDIPDIV